MCGNVLSWAAVLALPVDLLVPRHRLSPAFAALPCPPAAPPQVLPLIAVFMPLDAAASVMDGVLLGSQEAGWLSKTMAVTAGVCAVGLLASQRLAWPLTTIWFVIKFLAVGRLIGARSWLACAVHQPSLLGQRCVSLVVARPGPAWPVHQKEAHPALPAGLLVQAMPGGCGPGAAHWRGSCARLRHDGVALYWPPSTVCVAGLVATTRAPRRFRLDSFLNKHVGNQMCHALYHCSMLFF